MPPSLASRVARLFRRAAPAAALAGLIGLAGLAPRPATAAPSGKPIVIGFSMSLTGGLAANGKAALLAMQIWAEQTNAKDGLLGRPVKLDYYDDQSNPALVPGIYTKLLDVDHVDLIVSAYATNIVAPAMPIIMAHHRTFLGLLGLAVNSQFKYNRYFSIAPTGGMHPKQSLSVPFFAVAAAMKPKPKTIALVGADAEFPKNAIEGALQLAKANGFKVVYNQTYPPSTADFSPIIHAIQARHPDIVMVASYPPDSVGMVRAAAEAGLKTRLFGGDMVGLQSTPIKVALGPLLNGITDYDFWLPVKGYATPEAMAFLKIYQARAAKEGVDPLGYYLPPFAYSDMQVLGDAVEGTHSLDDAKLAAWMRSHSFNTVVGTIKFGPNGEWSAPRVLEAQFQGVKGHDVAAFRDPRTEVVLYPSSLASGTLQAPYHGGAH
ncbi:MAG: amino acid ABC transporter substrate-binding protein [Rhodospirillales bacterium]|nr:amino acid ABC transporter substrate-binding protein [Rhodospirillales bacterium]